MSDRGLIGPGDRNNFGAAAGDHEICSLALPVRGLQIIRRLPSSGQAMVPQNVRTIAHKKSVKHGAASNEHQEPTKRVAYRSVGVVGDLALCDSHVDIESLCRSAHSGLTLAERHCD